MKQLFSNIALCLILLIAALTAMPLAYPSLSAAKKADFLWDAITSDETSYGFMNPLKTLYYAAQTSYLWAMANTQGDWRESSHQKITHGVGGHARAHFEWLPNPYTGMFQKAEHCIVRMANAAEPGTLAMTAYGPNMAVKCLNDGPASANILTIWQLDGYAVIPENKTKSCSYFEAPLSNHNPLRDDVAMALRDTFVSDFDKVDKRSMLLGISPMAMVNQNGTSIPASNSHFPFALVFKPAVGLNDLGCEFNDYISQLKNIPASSKLYDVFAVAEPWVSAPEGKPEISKIGELKLDSGFEASKFGDTALFFRHKFFAQELLNVADENRARTWSKYVHDENVYKTLGAMLYEKFI